MRASSDFRKTVVTGGCAKKSRAQARRVLIGGCEGSHFTGPLNETGSGDERGNRRSTEKRENKISVVRIVNNEHCCPPLFCALPRAVNNAMYNDIEQPVTEKMSGQQKNAPPHTFPRRQRRDVLCN